LSERSGPRARFGKVTGCGKRLDRERFSFLDQDSSGKACRMKLNGPKRSGIVICAEGLSRAIEERSFRRQSMQARPPGCALEVALRRGGGWKIRLVGRIDGAGRGALTAGGGDGTATILST
jgi:hypothetical protein